MHVGGGVIANRTIKTQTELAEALETSLPTVRKWIHRAGFPGGAAGPWVLSQVELFLRAEGSPVVEGRGRAKSDDDVLLERSMLTSRALKLREEARGLKIKNDKLERRLVDREDAIVEMSLIFGKMRDRLTMLPDQAAAELAAEVKPEVIRHLRRHLKLLLLEFSNWGGAAFGAEGE